ncbi:hypothetical protein RJ641_008010 [Dillenia turbinata]|uniref:Uncharacterized protein n=1 Tax=Dillenia turbinata TaxID=194707 RepID=A0AAN8V9Y2_9MAGN
MHQKQTLLVGFLVSVLSWLRGLPPIYVTGSLRLFVAIIAAQCYSGKVAENVWMQYLGYLFGGLVSVSFLTFLSGLPDLGDDFKLECAIARLVRKSEDRKISVLIVFVDNILLTEDDTTEGERMKKVLGKEFEIKDLGPMKSSDSVESFIKLQWCIYCNSFAEIAFDAVTNDESGRLLFISKQSPAKWKRGAAYPTPGLQEEYTLYLYTVKNKRYGPKRKTTRRKISAASAAAFRMSFASVDAGTGNRQAESAKLRQAARPRSAMAATSWARAAISTVGYVPSHILVFLFGSRTSHTHLPELLRRTPRYTGCRVSWNFFRPARFLGFVEANKWVSLVPLSDAGDNAGMSDDQRYDPQGSGSDK